MIYDTFYEALVMQAAAIEAAVPEMPEHRFSLRYKRKKKALIKAYEMSQESRSDVETMLYRMRMRSMIRIAVIAVLSLLLLTGGGYVVMRYINGYVVHDMAHTTRLVFDEEATEGSLPTLFPKYYLTYDMSGYDVQIITDEEYAYSAKYTDGDKSVEFSYCKMGEYLDDHPDFDWEELHPGGNVEQDDRVVHTEPDGTQVITWEDWFYVFELRCRGITEGEGTDIYRSVNAPKYTITYDMSNFRVDAENYFSPHYRIFYQNDDNLLGFHYYTKSGYGKHEWRYETADEVEVTVRGKQAICYVAPDATFLTFDNGDYIFEFFTDVDLDTLIKIVDSIEMI